MLKFLARIVMLLIGIALGADALLPLREETLSVDQHRSSVTHQTTRDGFNRLADTSYTLHFIGGVPESCDVGYAAYNATQDGDVVSVRSTKIFRSCVHISKGDDSVLNDRYWKLWKLLGGGLLIAVAIGWLETDDDGAVRIF